MTAVPSKGDKVRIGGGLAAVALALAACGGTQASRAPYAAPTPVVQKSPSGMPSAAASIEVGPSPTASPTVEPFPSFAPSTYVEKAPGEFTWTAETGEVRNVPVPAGLRASLKTDGTIAYIAIDRRFAGIGAGTEVGNFRQDVFLQQDGVDVQIGGVALNGPVVAKLMQGRLDSISDPAMKLAIPSPVDPIGPLHVSFRSVSLVGGDYPAIEFAYAGPSAVSNPYPNSQKGMDCEPGSITQIKWMCNDFAGYGKSDAPPMSELMLFGQDPDAVTSHTQTDPDYPVGSNLVPAAREGVSIAGGAIGDPLPLDSGSLLTAGEAGNQSLLLLK